MTDDKPMDNVENNEAHDSSSDALQDALQNEMQDEMQARADEMIKNVLADDDEANDDAADIPATDLAEAQALATEEQAAPLEEPVQEPDQEQQDAAGQDAVEKAEEAQPRGPKKRFDDVSFDRAYRINVYYRVEDGQYGLHCAELGDLNVQAETRALALEKADKALEDRIAEFAVHGEELPKPFDLDLRQDYSGELKLKIGKSLHRDLSVAARREHISLNNLASNLLSEGLTRLRMEGRPAANNDRQNSRPRNDRGSNRNSNRGDSRRNSRRRGGMSEGQYKQVMEDKGAFMEYVRGLDNNGDIQRNNRGRRRR